MERIRATYKFLKILVYIGRWGTLKPKCILNYIYFYIIFIYQGIGNYLKLYKLPYIHRMLIYLSIYIFISGETFQFIMHKTKYEQENIENNRS